MKDERLEKLAEVLVSYSTKVKKGDKVAISAEDGALPFIKAVARAAVKKGALVEYYVVRAGKYSFRGVCEKRRLAQCMGQ